MAVATASNKPYSHSSRPFFTEGPRSGRGNNKVSTLHRENELKQVNYDGSESSDEDEVVSETTMTQQPPPVVMPFEVCRRDKGSIRSTPEFSPPSRNLSPPGYDHRPVSSQRSSPQFQSKFQQHILAAKSAKSAKKQAPPPNFMDIPWFHPGMSRHIAESILLTKNVPDGTYLLRNSTNSGTALTMSVSYKTSVKHYRVTWDGKDLCFGLGKFRSITEFVEHFESEPIISGDSGLLVYLKHPYPRSVKEFIDYEEPLFSEGLEVLGNNHKVPSGTPTPLTINSKDGYLTKLGYHRKNWKLRWFTLFKNTLSYYPTKEAVATNSPLRTINISDISAVENDTSMGKDHCFKLVTHYRTFYMFAQTEIEAEEWISVLRWKLAHNTKEIAI